MTPATTIQVEFERFRSRVMGCLLGGAIGDALGAPIEFSPLASIREYYGADGLTEPAPYNRQRGLITDDTQMTLFTCEGLITAILGDAGEPEQVAVPVYRSYLRWLDTQTKPAPPQPAGSWLAGQDWLYSPRAPGNACMSGLRSGRMGTAQSPANPNSKGCGAVMRSAPFGLQLTKKPSGVLRETIAGAVLTHGHPTGYLAAGAFAVIIRALVNGAGLEVGIQEALGLLEAWPGHEETTNAITEAVEAARRGSPSAETVERLGAGWVAEEALAIGLYAALAYPGPGQVRQALLLAVNHSGDSDSTGSITGNLLGTLHGPTALPTDWLSELEGRPTIEQLANDFATLTWPRTGRAAAVAWAQRYPGHSA